MLDLSGPDRREPDPRNIDANDAVKLHCRRNNPHNKKRAICGFSQHVSPIKMPGEIRRSRSHKHALAISRKFSSVWTCPRNKALISGRKVRINTQRKTRICHRSALDKSAFRRWPVFFALLGIYLLMTDNWAPVTLLMYSPGTFLISHIYFGGLMLFLWTLFGRAGGTDFRSK